MENIEKIGGTVSNILGRLGFGPAGATNRLGNALTVYLPEAAAQASDNLFGLIQDPLAAKLVESVAGWIGIAVTELVPQIQANPTLYKVLQEFFSHWGTKILDPTPDEWVKMGQSFQQMLSPAAFGNPMGQLQNMVNGIKANLDKVATSFGVPTFAAWPTWNQVFSAFALPNLAAGASALGPTVAQQALAISPPQGYQRSMQIGIPPPPTFGAPNLLGTVNLSASSARRL